MGFGLKDFHTQVILKKGEFLGYAKNKFGEYIPIEPIANDDILVLCEKNTDLSKDKIIISDNYDFATDILDKGEIESILKLKDGREIKVGILARRGISVFIDNNPIIFDKITPIIIDQTTLIPLRKVSESLGTTIEWDGLNKTITGIKDDKVFVLTVDSKTAILNGERVELLTPPVIINENTMVPARFIAESLGMEVRWEQDINSVKIYSDYGL